MTAARKRNKKYSLSPNEFWISRDGVIISQKQKDERSLELTVAFSPSGSEELAALGDHLSELRFSERSRLARLGVEIFLTSEPEIRERKIFVNCDAFVIDPRFPTARYFMHLLKSGTQVGRLFYAPENCKLNSNEVWKSVRANRIKLPDTVSIDRFGKVYFTPHRVTFTLPPNISERELSYLVSGDRPRSYLDKIQIRQSVENLSIPPRSGVLTSCSMYLPENYAVLRRETDHFGVHTGAVLLDPVKTFGTNVMLEIYNASDQFVVNPVVALDIYRAPGPSPAELESLRNRRNNLRRYMKSVYAAMAANPPEAAGRVRPRASITLKGQGPWEENESLVLSLPSRLKRKEALKSNMRGYRTLSQALSHAPAGGDTLVVRTFPNLSEHIEILARNKALNLKKLIFRNASRTHGFFFPESSQAQIEIYHEMGVQVYWYNEELDDLFVHTYKKNRGFFLREEQVRRFQASTILALYGSGESLTPEETDRIEHLVAALVDFFGCRVGILTGGGGGAMQVATEVGKRNDCMTGACFLELEAQEKVMNVDFFNAFRETSRHNRQKWFEVADFCIFNVGGVGTLEEIGIELCNLKLGIRSRAPLVFYSEHHWQSLREQVEKMVESGRTPPWVFDYLLFSGNPAEVVQFYKKKLQLL